MARFMRAAMGMVNHQLRIQPFVKDKIWTVESTMSGKLREYMVCKGDQGWSCTCPDYQKRGQDCKHILAVRLIAEQRV
jgi:predicted nucleic acid-binding Zn finger protein